MIPFNRPYMLGTELEYIAQAHRAGHLAGDGPFTKRCHAWLERHTGAPKVLLTHSCTGAMEMAALLLDLQPGDEVIMPSYTFVSTANAFALRGAVPVFVEVRPDTLNLDESLIEAAITPRTRAIAPVHYAGVGCEMRVIMEIAARHRIAVVEDAAQGVMSTYEDRPLGSFGTFGAYSFHETKNVISGEGGALVVNDRSYAEPAEIVREKGTDRSRFLRGMVDKYTWRAVGSSFLPGEITAAFLYAQLEQAQWLTDQRMRTWESYHAGFAAAEREGLLQRPHVPSNCGHNAHMYYVLAPDAESRTRLLGALKQDGINAVFHYVPLHDSPGGREFARSCGALDRTVNLAARLVRLPLWIGITQEQVERVIERVRCHLGQYAREGASAPLARPA